MAPDTLMMTRMFSAGWSQTGTHHENQDAFLLSPKLSLFAVADGISSGAHSGIASQLALKTLEQYWQGQQVRPTSEAFSDFSQTLTQSFLATHHVLKKWMQSDTRFSDSGAVATSLIFHQKMCGWTHLGDTQLSVYRNAQIHPLTYAQTQEVGGKKLLAQALGYSELIHPQVGIQEFSEDDLFCLFSDGISSVITSEELRRVLERQAHWTQSTGGLQELAQWLCSYARNRGSDDDLTAVFVRWKP